MIHKFIIIFALLSITASSASGETASCNVVDASERLVLLVCEKDLDESEMTAAASEACAERAFCNVWIWTDGSHAPATAPETDIELPENSRKNATAIWINEASNLIRIRQVN